MEHITVCTYQTYPHLPFALTTQQQMMTQRRAEELYQNELTKYNEDNSMLKHAAQNERRC